MKPISQAIVCVVFVALLLCVAIAQTELQENIPLYLALYGIVVINSFFIRRPEIATRLFYGLLIFLFFVAYVLFGDYLRNINAAPPVWKDYGEGQIRRVPNTDWVYPILAGIVLAPLSVLLYHKAKVRNSMLERGLALLFVLLMVGVYLGHRFF